MTQPTGQERAEFEQIMRDSQSYKPELLKWIGDRYEFDTMESSWQGFQLGMQAARRAQVVPQGWRLAPVVPTSEMLGAADREHAARGLASIALISYQAMLAAAPQPPACNPSMQPELATKAAPVQLPEPIGLFSYGAKDTRPTYHHGCFDKDRLNQILDEGVTGGPHRCEFAYAEP